MKALKQITILVLLVLAGGYGETSAQTLTNLYQFSGFSGNDGAKPAARLVQGSDGNFYGTTDSGGTNGDGTVFRISPSGNFTNLHQFSGGDGYEPIAALVQGSDGNFYGTTYLGPFGSGSGYGTVFRISPSGNFTNLHQFSVNDGAYPVAALVQGSDGNFYGTTLNGGTSGSGTVFRISSSGSFTNLHQFNGSDGYHPFAGLVQGSDGNFYGTTQAGGTSGRGTVFRISSSGSFTNLYQFSGIDGGGPLALVQGSDGNFYGTTTGGGTSTNCNGGCGTVFRISPSGSFTNLYQFSGIDGKSPAAGLVQGSDGNFYGTTTGGGTNGVGLGDGTVFRISPSGNFTNLHQFNGDDGLAPRAALVQGSDGNFYGTTLNGGTSTNCGPNGCGTVFKLFVPLNPPANQISGIQLSGSDIIFNIPSVAGETYQLQISSSMQPTNWVNVAGVSITNSIGALLTLTNFGGAVGSQGFYRFDITP